MKNADRNAKRKVIVVRVSESDLGHLNTGFNSSTCSKLSEYIRLLLLQKPIKYYHRNKSLDDLMIELIILRNELNAIGKNYNQEIKKLYQLSDTKEIRSWVRVTEPTKFQIEEKINQLKASIGKISESWLQ